MNPRHTLTALLAGLALNACNAAPPTPHSTPTLSRSRAALSGTELVSGPDAVASLDATRQARFAALQSESTVPPDLTVDVQSGAVLTASLSWSSGRATLADEALAFVSTYQSLLDPRVAASEYRVGTADLGCPSTVVTLDRVIGGQQVLGSRMTFHFDDQRRLVWVTNAIAPVPATLVGVPDPTKLPKAQPLANLMGKLSTKAAKRVPVLVPMADGSGLYKADLATWFSNGRYRGAVALGDTATSFELDASAQGAGRSSGALPVFSVGDHTDVPSQLSFRAMGGARVSFLLGERNPMESAYRFLEEHPTAFHTGAARCQFQPTRLTENPTVPGVFSVRLQQRHGQLPVFGADMVLRVEGRDTVQNVMARTRGSISVAPTPAVSASTALIDVKTVLQNGASADPSWKPAVNEALGLRPSAQLVVLPMFLHPDPLKKQDRLAWRVDQGAFTVLVDALDERILWGTSGRQGDSVVRDAQGAGVAGFFGYLTAELNGVPQPGAPSPANFDVAPGRLGGGVSASMLRFQGLLARNGWTGLRGHGGDLVANTNVNLEGGGCPNSFFDLFVTKTAFFCLGEASGDVVGHEFTHGVVDASSGLLYADQSGAIDEAYADLFGNLNDLNPGWLIGEQTLAGAIRDMQNPGAFGHPSHMSGYVARASACGPWPWACDFGGVHTNSGILNRAHVILSDGIPGSFSGMGRERLEHLAFITMTQHLPSSATLNQVAGATRDVCDMFVARGITTFSGLGYTPAMCDTVTNGFNAVGLNPSLGSGWAEPQLGFSGTDTINPPGADGRFPTTAGFCNVSNISLQHFVPVLGTSLFADYDPATPMPSSTSVLDWVATTAFDFSSVGTGPLGPLPLGTPVTTHSVHWTSAYGVRPAYHTDIVAPGTCAPPPIQDRSSALLTEGFDTGVAWGSDTRSLGNAAPASLPASCSLSDVNLELLDANGVDRLAGPSRNPSHTVTRWFLFVPVDFRASASVVSAPAGANMSGNVHLNWDLGRTVRVRWRYTFSSTGGASVNCNPL